MHVISSDQAVKRAMTLLLEHDEGTRTPEPERTIGTEPAGNKCPAKTATPHPAIAIRTPRNRRSSGSIRQNEDGAFLAEAACSQPTFQTLLADCPLGLFLVIPSYIIRDVLTKFQLVT